MRSGVTFVLSLVLVLGGCGEGETPPAPVEKGEAPLTEPVPQPAPEAAPAPEPKPEPEPAKEPQPGGDEEFEPPPNWCGTPGMWQRPGHETWKISGTAVFVNADGVEVHVPLEDLTPQAIAKMREKGWHLKARIEPGGKR